MEQGARAHTGKFTLEMLKNKKQLRLLETHQWLTINSDLNPVDFVIWGLLVQELWRCLSITDLHPLKKVIVEEWSKILQETIHKCIASFEPRLRRANEVVFLPTSAFLEKDKVKLLFSLVWVMDI